MVQFRLFFSSHVHMCISFLLEHQKHCKKEKRKQVFTAFLGIIISYPHSLPLPLPNQEEVKGSGPACCPMSLPFHVIGKSKWLTWGRNVTRKAEGPLATCGSQGSTASSSALAGEHAASRGHQLPQAQTRSAFPVFSLSFAEPPCIASSPKFCDTSCDLGSTLRVSLCSRARSTLPWDFTYKTQV